MGYKTPEPALWTGRTSDRQLYLHEMVSCIPIDALNKNVSGKTFAIIGYDCDEGVRRNNGRTGAVNGPGAIRRQLARMPNHLSENTQLIDVGSVSCTDVDLEACQKSLSDMVLEVLEKRAFPIVLGGGHDIAYGHYNGIKKYVDKKGSIGIINFDAHFDLRSSENGANSGTPFHQIAQDCKTEGTLFKYLCLGIRKDANDRILFQTAQNYGVPYVENRNFNIHHIKDIESTLHQFIKEVDHIYVTIDMDGFSSAYAPGVSSPYPTGYDPAIVFESLQFILDSKKLISLDLAEMNPAYDIDNQTAKLAAALVHFVIHTVQDI